MKFAHCRLWEALVKTHKYLYILAIVFTVYTVLVSLYERHPQPTLGKFHTTGLLV
jgi:hypothetical protein